MNVKNGVQQYVVAISSGKRHLYAFTRVGNRILPKFLFCMQRKVNIIRSCLSFGSLYKNNVKKTYCTLVHEKRNSRPTMFVYIQYKCIHNI